MKNTKISFATFEEAKANFAKVSKDTEATAEQKTEALNDMLSALQKETESSVLSQAQSVTGDNSILINRGNNVLTSEEREFFNVVIEEGGFKDVDTLPTTTQERIFEDLVHEHPLLTHLNIRNLGAVTEFIYSDPEGMAVWGELFGDIQGQLNATFRSDTITQNKLTAFIPLSNDMLDLGPEWVERYVRTMLVEAISVGLERGFVTGTGQNGEPVGLTKEVESNGAVVDKEPAGTLTFKPGRTTINELRDVVKLLSRKLNADGTDSDRPRRVAGKIVMVTNPFDSFDIQANATVLNHNGQYVTSLPFNPIMTESVFVEEGTALFFVKDEYIAAYGGALQLKKFDQTLAMQDATLYIAKQYATGKPVDKYASQVYTLDVDTSNDDEVVDP